MKCDKSKAFVAFLLMLLSWQGLAWGGEAPSGLPSQPLTLKDAISYALVHNRSYLAARQEVDSVSQQVRQARADFYPKVDANYAFTNWKDHPTLFLMTSTLIFLLSMKSLGTRAYSAHFYRFCAELPVEHCQNEPQDCGISPG